MGELLKVFRNKKNNQLFVALSRKKLRIGDEDPEFIKLKIKNLIFKKKKEKGLI